MAPAARLLSRGLSSSRADLERATLTLNRLARLLRFTFLPGELEGAMLEGTTPATRGQLAAAMGPGAPTSKE